MGKSCGNKKVNLDGNVIEREKLAVKIMMKIIRLATIIVAIVCLFVQQPALADSEKKLYWFIPDGMRADPHSFNIYEWAEKGELPNIKKLMDNGTYGFCKPVYPGHTPVNFASLFTGTYPEVHGVADGPMHTEDHPLTKPTVAGFRSTAKQVEPIWVTLEEQNKKVALLSIPGSTPPELKTGYTMLGRWGGWGANFHAVNFEELGDGQMMNSLGRGAKLFFLGQPLTVFEPAVISDDTDIPVASYSPPKMVVLKAWGTNIKAYICDTTDDKIVNYTLMVFTDNKGKVFTRLEEGQWSDWHPIDLIWKDLEIATDFKVRVIKLTDSGFYRVRFLYNNLNASVTHPSYLAEDIVEKTGPMVDFVDNFPPQLIFYDEDKDAFIDEANMSFDSHRKIARHFIDIYSPDVIIHDIYSPNQMLTSRWWLGYIDPDSARYGEKTEAERNELWAEVKAMYKKLDDIIGEYLNSADEDTIIALSSDHGAAPLNRWVHLNNLFAEKGWLKFSIDPTNGMPTIDWRNSTVIYLKFDNIYISPEGLHGEDGKWHRAKGEKFEKLRQEVIKELTNLSDNDGTKPLVKIAKGEAAENIFRLPFERVGDLVIANRVGYGWNEEMSNDLKTFSTPLKTGYKQAVLSDDCPAMWTPFMIMGPGIKKGNFLGDKPIDLVDQYPTIMKLLGIAQPDFVQGKALDQLLVQDDED